MTSSNRKCPKCEKYKSAGHNYCRICGFHLTKGHVQNVRHGVVYSTNEKFCGYCGGAKQKCGC
jgi:hypothetical protein